jgi:hypothetical protein
LEAEIDLSIYIYIYSLKIPAALSAPYMHSYIGVKKCVSVKSTRTLDGPGQSGRLEHDFCAMETRSGVACSMPVQMTPTSLIELPRIMSYITLVLRYLLNPLYRISEKDITIFIIRLM